jgi:hypothetical protein
MKIFLLMLLMFDYVSRKINKVSLEHMAAWKKASIPLEEKWMPPPPHWFKINFDTAIRDTFSAQAAVCRDHLGHIIKWTPRLIPNVYQIWEKF